VIGPSRSGKTSSIIVPNLLVRGGSCVITSTKDDVVSAMMHRRRDVITMLFDPSGEVDNEKIMRVGYSPVRNSLIWDRALITARGLLEARRPSLRQLEDHWNERAGTLVAPLLHAAALNEVPLRELVRRVDDRAVQWAIAVLLDYHGVAHASVSSLRAIENTEERERSSIWSTTAGLFAGLRSDAALAAAELPGVDYDDFFARPHHLHVVSPSRHQSVLTPMVVGLIDELVEETYRRPQASLLLALDELANVAPLPRLPSIVSEGGGQGVTILACLQDLSQARVRWGQAGEGLVSLFPTVCVLPGVADRSTLNLFSTLAGEIPTPQVTQQRRHHSVTWTPRPRLLPAHVAQGRPGFALVAAPRRNPEWVELTPFRFSAPT
jgi:type IV secretion system protein VirD4